MTEPTQADKKAGPQGGRVRRELLSWVRLILISLVLAFLISNFVVVNAVVPTGSMENTIQVSDRIMAFRLTYLFEDPARGDIIIFEPPDGDEDWYGGDSRRRGLHQRNAIAGGLCKGTYRGSIRPLPCPGGQLLHDGGQPQ